MFLHHLAIFHSVALSSLGFVLPDSSTWSSFVGFKIHSFRCEVSHGVWLAPVLLNACFRVFVAATPSTVVSCRRSFVTCRLSCPGSLCARFPFLRISSHFLRAILHVFSLYSQEWTEQRSRSRNISFFSFVPVRILRNIFRLLIFDSLSILDSRCRLFDPCFRLFDSSTFSILVFDFFNSGFVDP